MGQVIDLTGRKFNRWTVIGLSHQVGKMLYWHCVCDCGTKRAVFGADLKRGGSVSCGCYKREASAARLRSHDMSFHPAYASWKYMKSRCASPNNTMYHLYGGRGIKVCKRWQKFENFWKDMGPAWKDGLSIERIDYDGDYTPANCTWATAAEQAANRCTEHLIDTPKGRMSVTEAGRLFGIKPVTIFTRIGYGWPEHRLLEPVRDWSPGKPSKTKGKKRNGHNPDIDLKHVQHVLEFDT